MCRGGLRELMLEKIERGRNGAEGGTRTPTGCPIRPSNVRVYQFHHFGFVKRGSTINRVLPQRYLTSSFRAQA